MKMPWNLIETKRSYEKLSFSQSGEDLIVRFIFEAIGVKKPTYLDIGAHHPFALSNTAHFYCGGSHGINIEPDPDLYVKLKNSRRRDINLNVGIDSQHGIATMYLMSPPSLNTFSEKQVANLVSGGQAQLRGKISVPLETVHGVLEDHWNGDFPDFLSLDTEDMDLTILQSIDYSQMQPSVICVETISFSTSGRGTKNRAIIDYLSERGYMMYADTYINTIFVRQDVWVR